MEWLQWAPGIQSRSTTLIYDPYGMTIPKMLIAVIFVLYLILPKKDKGNISHGSFLPVGNFPFSEPERTVVLLEPGGKITPTINIQAN